MVKSDIRIEKLAKLLPHLSREEIKAELDKQNEALLAISLRRRERKGGGSKCRNLES